MRRTILFGDSPRAKGGVGGGADTESRELLSPEVSPRAKGEGVPLGSGTETQETILSGDSPRAKGGVGGGADTQTQGIALSGESNPLHPRESAGGIPVFPPDPLLETAKLRGATEAPPLLETSPQGQGQEESIPQSATLTAPFIERELYKEEGELQEVSIPLFS